MTRSTSFVFRLDLEGDFFADELRRDGGDDADGDPGGDSNTDADDDERDEDK